MASIHTYLELLNPLEGGYVNRKNDRGGPTNRGITLATLRMAGYDKNGDGIINAEDVKLITYQDLLEITKKYYWDRVKADDIINQSLANIICDFTFHSGAWGIIIPQRILRDEFNIKIKVDGIVGSKTLLAINLAPQLQFFMEIKKARKKFLIDIVNGDPTQKENLKGWINRLDKLEFKYNL